MVQQVTTLEEAAMAVEQFMYEMNLPKGGNVYSKLVAEELEELEEAESLAEVWKEAGDLLFVTLGKILEMGVTPKQISMLFTRVALSNTSKIADTAQEVQQWIEENGHHAYVQETPGGYFIAKDPTGKALKGPNYKPVIFTEDDLKDH